MERESQNFNTLGECVDERFGGRGCRMDNISTKEKCVLFYKCVQAANLGLENSDRVCPQGDTTRRSVAWIHVVIFCL